MVNGTLLNFGKRYNDNLTVIFDQWLKLHLGLDALSIKKSWKVSTYYLVDTRAKNYVQDNYIFTWRCDPFKLKYTFFRSLVEPVISYFCII